METNDTRQPSPWAPVTDPKTLAILGKLCEELGECNTAAARCIIQGITEREPTTAKPNGEWLIEELADVAAGIELVKELISANEDFFQKRKARKLAHLRSWHLLIEAANAPH